MEEVEKVYACELVLGILSPSTLNNDAIPTTKDYCPELPDVDEDPTEEGDIPYVHARSPSPRPARKSLSCTPKTRNLRGMDYALIRVPERYSRG